MKSSSSSVLSNFSPPSPLPTTTTRHLSSSSTSSAPSSKSPIDPSLSPQFLTTNDNNKKHSTALPRSHANFTNLINSVLSSIETSNRDEDSKNSSFSSSNPSSSLLSNFHFATKESQEDSPMSSSKPHTIKLKLNHTIPEEFDFQLPKRHPESRHEEYSYQRKKEIMEECTFQPQISELPQQYSRSKLEKFVEIPFVERAMHWKEKVERERAMKGERIKQSEMSDCTFKPNVNPNSLELTSSTDVTFSNMGNTNNSRTTNAIHERLYNNSIIMKLKKEEERERLQDMEFKKQCTFKPQIHTMKSPTQSRYKESQRPHTSREKELDPNIRECTFTPHINPLNKKFGSGSSIYLQTNAFERLSKPKSPNKNKSFEENTRQSPKRPSSAHSSFNRTSTSICSDGSSYGFGSFLERQEFTTKKKEEKINFLKSAMEPSFKPNINKRSSALMKCKNYNFSMRYIEANSLQQQQQHQLQQALLQHQHLQDQCTFKPKINKKSKSLKRRTYEEMSIGDYMNYQDKKKQAQQLKEMKEMEEVSFKPKINSYPHVKSYLGLSDPEGYMAKINAMKQKQDEIRKNAELEKQQKEESECTFKPVTHEAPAYVKRIARSMAIARQMDPPSQPKKPDWR